VDFEPGWTQEVMADEHLVELSPYPSSRVGASGFIGWSNSANRVLVVIAYRDLCRRHVKTDQGAAPEN
jgi:hypothetical protein